MILFLCNHCLRKVGQYNRDFAKQWLPRMDRDFGKDGKSLDLAKATKWMAEGKEYDKCCEYLSPFFFFFFLRNRSSNSLFSFFYCFVCVLQYRCHLCVISFEYCLFSARA